MLGTEREDMLAIFPGLDAYWDKDGGKTFLEVFFWLYCKKIEIYNQWRSMKFYGGASRPFTGLDAMILRMRLVGDREDFRPYFTEDQEIFLDEMDDKLVMGPVTFSKERTCEILEMSLTHKTFEEENNKNMEDLLRYAFAFKERCSETT